MLAVAIGRRWRATSLLDARAVDGGAAAPEEGSLVELHRDAVQLDGALDATRGQRHPALLVGVAEHEHVGGDRVAQQRGREPVASRKSRRLGAGRASIDVLQRVRGKASRDCWRIRR